jgi:predicted membrane protein
MLVGVVAYNVLDVMDYNESRSIGVLLVGYFFQGVPRDSLIYPAMSNLILGLGFFMTFFYICIYILRIFLVGIGCHSLLIWH